MDKQIKQILDGNNNQQNVTIYNGTQFSIDDIKQISKESALQVIQEHFASGTAKAQERVELFNSTFINTASVVKDWTSMFADPAFIYDFKIAQIQSALTDDEISYKMLSHLLLHRSKNRKNISKITSIRGAIQIVNQIDESSLTGLTIASCLSFGIRPVTNLLEEGLKTLNDLFGKILVNNLPVGYKWLDQLDILKAIRISSFGRLQKFCNLMQQTFEGYIQLGIKKDSDLFIEFNEKQKALSMNMFIENRFNNQYVLLPFISLNQINELADEKLLNLSPEQLDLLKNIYNSYEKNSAEIAKIKNKFNELVLSYNNLKKINNWWDNISNSFTITSIGKTLGHVNAINLYPKFPPLD